MLAGCQVSFTALVKLFLPLHSLAPTFEADLKNSWNLSSKVGGAVNQSGGGRDSLFFDVKNIAE